MALSTDNHFQIPISIVPVHKNPCVRNRMQCVIDNCTPVQFEFIAHNRFLERFWIVLRMYHGYLIWQTIKIWRASLCKNQQENTINLHAGTKIPRHRNLFFGSNYEGIKELLPNDLYINRLRYFFLGAPDTTDHSGLPSLLASSKQCLVSFRHPKRSTLPKIT